jgi:hypothetical protein
MSLNPNLAMTFFYQLVFTTRISKPEYVECSPKQIFFQLRSARYWNNSLLTMVMHPLYNFGMNNEFWIAPLGCAASVGHRQKPVQAARKNIENSLSIVSLKFGVICYIFCRNLFIIL